MFALSTSLAILTHNAAARIDRGLDSRQFADDTWVVVDVSDPCLHHDRTRRNPDPVALAADLLTRHGIDR